MEWLLPKPPSTTWQSVPKRRYRGEESNYYYAGGGNRGENATLNKTRESEFRLNCDLNDEILHYPVTKTLTKRNKSITNVNRNGGNQTHDVRDMGKGLKQISCNQESHFREK